MTSFNIERRTPPCLICHEAHEYCTRTGKVRYRSRAHARRHRIGMRSRRSWMKLESVYECPHCGEWHVTSLKGGQK